MRIDVRSGMLSLLGTLLAVLISPTLVAAGPIDFWVNIQEPNEDPMQGSLSDRGYVTATDPFTIAGGYVGTGATGANEQEGPGKLGGVSAHFEYTDATPLANGTSQTVNFNILEPGSTIISDTLSVTFTGHIGTNGENMSVDLSFLSGSTDDLLNPPSLPNAFLVGELVDLSTILAGATGLSGAHIMINSVPEPGSIALMGLGGIAFAGRLWVRRRRLRAPVKAD